MRKIILLFILIPSGYLLNAQSVGIGTTTPNASAQLDVTSSSKGFLIPRMTSTNRVLISNPANGLMVYDTTQNRMYQYQNGVWRFLINNDYWVQSTTRNWVYNGTDSVGIGTASPTQRLDVNGNIRSRDDVLADGRVIATGIVSGSSLQTSGNLAVSGIGNVGGDFTANGNLTTYSDLIIYNTGATLQLKNGSNVNKGFFQLSGDNVRLGTNSGNTAGKLIFRNNGADRIAVEADGKLTTPATGDNRSLIPLCYGLVNENGDWVGGTDNVTIEKVGTQGTSTPCYYRIICSGITLSSIISVTPDITYLDYTAARCYLGGTARVYTYTKGFNPVTQNNEYSYFHSGFSFVIYK